MPKCRFKNLYPAQYYDEEQKQFYRLMDQNDLIKPTNDMPTILFLNPHNTILATETCWSIESPYAAVSKEGITAFCENTAEALNNSQQGYQRITGSSYPRTIRNYRLTKFDWSAEELALGPLTNYREYVACTIDQMTEHDELPPCDVYTIRKKTPFSQPESYFDPLKKEVIVKLSLLLAAVPTMMKTRPNII